MAARPLAVVVALGGVAHLTPWVLGPAKGVGAVAREGLALARLCRVNGNDVPRPYRIPGGLPGVWLVGGVGLLGCAVSFLLGVVPPDQLQTGNPVGYVLLLALATVVLSLPPFVLALLERRRNAGHGRVRALQER